MLGCGAVAMHTGIRGGSVEGAGNNTTCGNESLVGYGDDFEHSCGTCPELGYLAGITTSSNAVRDESLINQGHAATGGAAANANASHPQPTDQQATLEGLRGDLLVRGVWAKHTSCIIDVHVCDTTDSNSYTSLQLQRKCYRSKHPCLDSHRDFTPYVLLVDGMLATEAKELNKRLA
eukprot:scaffold678286_cov86-Attheya_sp.AAC.1